MSKLAPARDMPSRQKGKLDRYYRWHAPIYDLTRWSFLFGRERLLGLLPDLPPEPRILEIGCGTGKMLRQLQYLYPDAHICGVDLSTDMLSKAKKKFADSDAVTLYQAEYGYNELQQPPFDLILLSYTLSMLQNHPDQLFSQFTEDLAARGHVAVVDFNNSPFRSFRRWMKMNHVAINGQIALLLHKYFTPTHHQIYPAYFGLWNYFTFIGR